MSPTIRNQAKLAGIALAGLGLALAFSPAAHAISDAQQCDRDGGVYEKIGSESTCTISTTPGKNQGGVTKENEVSQKGSFKSSHPKEEEDCVANRGGEHCK